MRFPDVVIKIIDLGYKVESMKVDLDHLFNIIKRLEADIKAVSPNASVWAITEDHEVSRETSEGA